MSIEAAVRTRLLAHAGVAALVYDAAGTDPFKERVYPAVLPQGPTFPAITYEVIGGPRANTFGGPGGLPGDLVRLHCWGGEGPSGFDAVVALAKQARLAFDGYQGTSQGETIQSSWMEAGALPDFEPETQVHRRILDFRVFWNEPQA